MTGHDRPARLNRAVLAVTGLLLLAAGGFALATRFAVLDVLAPDAPLVPGDALPPPWVWNVIAVAGTALGLLAVRWLVAQVARAPRSSLWRFDTDGSGRTELAASTALAPLLAEAGAYPGVREARGVLTGAGNAPRLELVISTDRDGEPGAIRRALATGGLPRLRRALDLDRLPTTVEFRLTGNPGARTAPPTSSEQARER
ncbi:MULTISPECIES: alkaline shock response membrane anchor protein AmaP [Actinosynnema]|uniref:alkaline shock response membrane anchor protein AmaP n=1 Tax=Actinosynnema TaxID=40566 RepID=UPI0020A5CDF4|nr:alkaline shock response membrane anchor protein AmaP [Actinosynnema pretiosum]MCP2092151.1 hypothetical protein [Actinosynnema pretiosum]